MYEEGRSEHSPELRTPGRGASEAGRRRGSPASPSQPTPAIGGCRREEDQGTFASPPVSLQGHLPKRQPPLCQGKHPPTMYGGNHSRSGVGGGGDYSLGERWEQLAVIPEVEPPACRITGRLH